MCAWKCGTKSRNKMSKLQGALSQRAALNEFITCGNLGRQEEGLDQLALTAYDQFRKPLEPLAFRNLRAGIHPP